MTKPPTPNPAPKQNTSVDDPPSEFELALLASLMLPPGTLYSAPYGAGGEIKDAVMKEAVDDALRLFYYARKRRTDLQAHRKNELIAGSALWKFTSLATAHALEKNTAARDATALRFAPQKPTDELREHLKAKRPSVDYQEGYKLMAALKRWQSESSATQWMCSTVQLDQQKQQANECFDRCFERWLDEYRRGDHYLIPRREADAFAKWKISTDQANERRRKAEQRERERAAKAAAKAKKRPRKS